MIRAVLFDAAGTLIELREPVGETYSRAAREFGVKLSAWRLGDAFRRVLAGAPAMVFPGAPPAEVAEREREWWRGVVRATLRAADSTVVVPDFEGFFDSLWRLYAGAGAWAARPGARALLDRLRREGRRCAVVSNFDQRLPGVLEALDLAAPLDAVVLPAEAGVAKPDPRIFSLALAKLGVAASEAIFVGDSADDDLAGARALGLRAVDATTLATLDGLRVDEAGGQDA